MSRLGIARAPLALMMVALVGCNNSDGNTHSDVVRFGPLTDTPVAFTLSGTIHYEDRLLGSTGGGNYGFTGTKMNPVRYALVDVVDENGMVLKTTATGADGRYTLSVTAAGLLHLRVLAQTDSATGINVEVRNPGGELYAVSRYFIPAAGNLTLDSDIPIAAMAGAFNILDVFTAGAEFVYGNDRVFPPKLVGYWGSGSADGTYFTNNTIHILGGGGIPRGDTDEYDDDVLLHEYGHFIESIKGNLDSMGGAHDLGKNTQDLRLAWSEGFASFISGTIKKGLALSPMLSDTTAIDSLYLDTIGNTAAIAWLFNANYAALPRQQDIANSYASAETAVAKVLWNLATQIGIPQTWSTYKTPPPSTRPYSLETFWDRWLNPSAAVGAAFSERRVDYLLDGFEAGEPNTPQVLQLGTATLAGTRTLYGANDVDYFDVSLAPNTQYVVETFGLTNGADTLVEVDLPSNAPLVTCTNLSAPCNNSGGLTPSGAWASLNINDGCTLASRVTFTTATSPNPADIYHLRVSSPVTPPLAAGRYGSYRILVSQNPPTFQCP